MDHDDKANQEHSTNSNDTPSPTAQFGFGDDLEEKWAEYNLEYHDYNETDLLIDPSISTTSITDLPIELLSTIISYLDSQCAVWLPYHIPIASHPHRPTNYRSIGYDVTCAKFKLSLVNRQFHAAVHTSAAWRRHRMKLFIRRCQDEPEVIVNGNWLSPERAVNAISNLLSVMPLHELHLNMRTASDQQETCNLLEQCLQAFANVPSYRRPKSVELLIHNPDQIPTYASLLERIGGSIDRLSIIIDRDVIKSPILTADQTDDTPIIDSHDGTWWYEYISGHCPLPVLNESEQVELAKGLRTCNKLTELTLENMHRVTPQFVHMIRGRLPLQKLQIRGDDADTWFVPDLIDDEKAKCDIELELLRDTPLMEPTDHLITFMPAHARERVTQLRCSDCISPGWLLNAFELLPNLKKLHLETCPGLTSSNVIDFASKAVQKYNVQQSDPNANAVELEFILSYDLYLTGNGQCPVSVLRDTLLWYGEQRPNGRSGRYRRGRGRGRRPQEPRFKFRATNRLRTEGVFRLEYCTMALALVYTR